MTASSILCDIVGVGGLELFRLERDLVRNSAPCELSRELAVRLATVGAIVGSPPMTSPPELDDSVIGVVCELLLVDVRLAIRLITSILANEARSQEKR